MVDAELAKACDSAAQAATEALEWINLAKNEKILGHERAFLERTIRNEAYRLRRLARSLDRPMCVGVFGPSQAGKSYLVSVLGRKGDALIALFDDPSRPEVDFIRDINPFGEKEATGLVTRFSINPPKTPPGFPVALRLLTQTDVLKILCNSYFFDGDLEAETSLSPDDIGKHIASFDARLRAGYADVLREEDIWEVEEYFQRQLRRAEAKLFAPFWPRFAALAPRLEIADRAELFSILWGGHRELTGLFLTLLESLSRLGFAEDAFCALDALTPAATGILNVETLAGLGAANANAMEISAGGKIMSMPRAVVTALAAELRMTMKEAPWPFFDHTDLLDFPGYRSRTPTNLTKYLREAGGGALKELFLRGKVDYLFQRYTAEQELTSMLLCLRPSNLEVATLPAVIEEWIGATHGASPAARRGRPQLLFFILTMFDQHLSETVVSAGEDVDPGLRFQARLEASLLKPFAKMVDSWPRKWTPEEPFKNCFWIRNPNYKAEGVIQYDGRREVAVLPQKVERIAQLRAAHAKAPEVIEHFRDPDRAFDEVMRLNDGGVSYLAAALEQVCKPGMKQAQARNRMSDLKKRMFDTLAPHYVPTDSEQRVAERTVVADTVLDDFAECIQRQTFGTFLRGLCVDRGDLVEAFYEARLSGALSESRAEPSDETKPVSASKQERLSAIIKRLGKPELQPSAPPINSAAASPRPRAARYEGLARAAMQLWSKSVHGACEDLAFAEATGVPPKALKEVATEVLATARRKGLETNLRVAITDATHIETTEQAAAKATIIAERLINRFVSTLGVDQAARNTQFDASGVGERPTDFRQEFFLMWLKSFYDQTIANALSSDGLILDPEQNAKLGEILKGFSA